MYRDTCTDDRGFVMLRRWFRVRIGYGYGDGYGYDGLDTCTCSMMAEALEGRNRNEGALGSVVGR